MSSLNWTRRGPSFTRAICLVLIVVASGHRGTAFGQEKPAENDAAQRIVTSRSAQTLSAVDRQSFENLKRLIRSGGGLWSADYTLKPRPLFLSS